MEHERKPNIKPYIVPVEAVWNLTQTRLASKSHYPK